MSAFREAVAAMKVPTTRTFEMLMDRIKNDLKVYPNPRMRTIHQVALRIGATPDVIILAGAKSDEIYVNCETGIVSLAR